MALNNLIRWAAYKKGTYWYLAPYYNQAKKIVWQDPEMLPKYCPPEFWRKRNNTEQFIPFPNGSILYVLGADKPDSLRGPNPKGVVLDEYGDMREEIWSGILQPIMTANPDAWCWFVGTPKGKNDFWLKYQFAKNNPDWFSSILKASESGLIPKEALEEAKKTTTQAFFNQEYECDFLDNASSVFRRVKENIHNEKINPEPFKRYQMGIDLAKYQDWTVISILDLHTMKMAEPIRFNQIDWNLQKARIESEYFRWNKPNTFMDTSGLGDPIYDDLSARGISINGFKFPEQSRNALLQNLALMLEQDKIKIPNYEPLISELEAFRYELVGRKVRMQVPEGMNDDCVISAALACWQAEKLPYDYQYQQSQNFLKFSPSKY